MHAYTNARILLGRLNIGDFIQKSPIVNIFPHQYFVLYGIWHIGIIMILSCIILMGKISLSHSPS